MVVIHKYMRRQVKFPNVWCAGCGNGIILSTIVNAIDSLGLSRDEVVLVSGIGCSSRAPLYVDFNTLHTTHGRAIPFATGVKLANPKLTVIVITGDGDASAIGGNHLIHACRRNIDITTVIFNNYIYGMTGGQYSPTTPCGAKASTMPYGNTDHPFDLCKLTMGAGATFVARSTVYHAKILESYIKKGIENKGFSVIDALSNCHVIYGRYNKKGSAFDMINWFKDNTINVNTAIKQWGNLETAEENIGQKILTGVFKEKPLPEYTAEYDKLIERLKEKAK